MQTSQLYHVSTSMTIINTGKVMSGSGISLIHSNGITISNWQSTSTTCSGKQSHTTAASCLTSQKCLHYKQRLQKCRKEF
jgi:hypothetical protein